jgi:uncharacterized protein (TIGR02391 family)
MKGIKENFGELLHPELADLVIGRFESGHYADAVESAFKYIVNRVKRNYLLVKGIELDGVDLMRKAFKPNDPAIILDDLESITGKNIQEGYMQVFAGAVQGIRNPKAHDNITITRERAIHHIMLASLLSYVLDDARTELRGHNT